MNSIQNKQQDGLLGENAGDYLSLINTDKIIQITQNDGSKTYTFALNMHETDTLTNLVAKENGNGFDYYLVKYSSPQFELWKTAIANREYSDVSVTIENISLDGYSNSARGSCFDFAYSCPSGQHNSISELGFCIFPPYEWTATTYAVPCDEGGGGGGGGGHGGPNPPPALDPYTEPIIPTLSPAIPVFIASFSPVHTAWWNAANNDIKSDIVNYLNQNIRYDSIKIEAKLFINWAINYLINNPNVSWAQLQNWFMSPSQGQDWNYDSNFWENPNLSFPQQDLPSREDYKAGMPKFENGNLMTGADNIYNLVGGDVLQVRNQYPPKRTNNTCALKVSIALNRSGVIIPNIPGQTIEGGGDEFSGKFFFLNAKALNAWMRETFGTNPATATTPHNDKHLSFTGSVGGTNGENFPNLQDLQNISGIYSMVTVEGTNEASGHADYIYTNTDGKVTCPFNCFFNLQIERIDVWILE